MATTTATESFAIEPTFEAAPTLVAQLRTFLWLASGLFSTSSLAIAFVDVFVAEAYAQASTHFIAAVVAAVIFGVATVMKLGPDVA